MPARYHLGENAETKFSPKTPQKYQKLYRKFNDSYDMHYSKILGDMRRAIKGVGWTSEIKRDEAAEAVKKYDFEVGAAIEGGMSYHDVVGKFFGKHLGTYSDVGNYEYLAKEIANLSASQQASDETGVGNPNIMEVFINARDILLEDVQGFNNDYAFELMNKTIDKATRSKLDGVIIKNITDGGDASNHFIVFAPNQIKSATDNTGAFDAGNDDIRFSRSPAARQAYEARIDELFAGGKANRVGARVLDRSDVLGLLGHAEKPVVLAEGKVLAGQQNHPRMTAAVWKKVPEWLENPAAVFESDTEKGRLVVIAPELVNGAPVSIIVEPNPTAGGEQLYASLLVNAYDRSGKTPFMRWIGDGLMRYADKTKFPAVFALSVGRRLPDTALQNKPGTARILTEKHLAAWRRVHSPAFRQG